MHKKKIHALFGQIPRTFRHTAFIYNNDLARTIERMGYTVMMAEGTDKDLGWRSSNYVYRPTDCKKLKILFRNRRLSADMGFHFSSLQQSEHPLPADKYAKWLNNTNDKGDIINFFMDYEPSGERPCEEAGIFEFIRLLPKEFLKHHDFGFNTPAEIAENYDEVGSIAGSDSGSDTSAWLGNALQKDAVKTLYRMESAVRRRKYDQLLHTWRMLQDSDHLYSMHTGSIFDGNAHQRLNPYGSPYDSYINFMNIMDDFSGVLGKKRSVVHEGSK
jgi:alpha-amylase